MSLLAVPNFSEGRDTSVIAAIRAALDRERGLLDRHSDAEHNRTVYTLTGDGRSLDELLAAAAAVAVERIDMRRHRGLHPCIGALDVSPLVWLDEQGREPATERARSVGEQIAGLGVPVFLYGDLASSEQRRERAFFREGGLETLRQRMKAGELAPDLGPAIPHLSAGATLVTARPPLAAFNLELDTADAAVAQRVAAALREAGGGPKGVRAIGLPLGDGRSQVSRTCTTRSRCLCESWSSGCGSSPSSSVPGRSRPRSSAWCRRRPFRAFRPTFRSAISTRSAM